MFERALLSTSINSSWDERTRRGFTTLTSFGLQALALVVLLLVQLLRPMGLPSYHQLSRPIRLGQPLTDVASVREHPGASPAAPNPTNIVLRLRSEIRHGVNRASDEGPPQIGISGPYVPGAIDLGNGDPHGVANVLGGGSLPVMPAPQPKPVVHSVRLSQMSEGDLIRKVVPTYPPLARSARIQGQVLLQAVISKQGTIENLRLLSGHPMLVPAAIEAVRQWRYRPYILNSEPVEVETQITVNFSLGGK